MLRKQDNLFHSMVKKTPRSKEDKQLFNKISTYFNDNYNDHSFCVHRLCDLTGKSQPTLYRKFIMYTDMSPVEFIQRYRIEKAKLLLIQSSLNISEISFETGFKEPKYFINRFKLYMGASPGKYRKIG